MISQHKLVELLSPTNKINFLAIKKEAERLLDYSPRFKYFTLHGKAHIESMLKIADMLIEFGINLSEDEAYLFGLAICIHDLGMVIPLKETDYKKIFEGTTQLPDPAYIENYIRNAHHELIDNYVETHFDFFSSLGISPNEIGLLKEISKNHRKMPLHTQTGLIKELGGLLRVIDELDIGSDRAPSSVLRNTYREMDGTSCWHWFKHNIVDTWRKGHNVHKIQNGQGSSLTFQLIVRSPLERNIPYWLHQIKKPINKVLSGENVAQIILEHWKIKIKIEEMSDLSKPNYLGSEWEKIEQKALSHSRGVILLIDDEVRKMEDLFTNLMKDFHIIYSPNAKDALEKINEINVDLAIVDMQIGSGKLWTSQETGDYKLTGKKLCEEIITKSPKTKIGILTGTRYDLDPCRDLPLIFLLKKPIDPEDFERRIFNVFR